MKKREKGKGNEDSEEIHNKKRTKRMNKEG